MGPLLEWCILHHYMDCKTTCHCFAAPAVFFIQVSFARHCSVGVTVCCIDSFCLAPVSFELVSVFAPVSVLVSPHRSACVTVCCSRSLVHAVFLSCCYHLVFSICSAVHWVAQLCSACVTVCCCGSFLLLGNTFFRTSTSLLSRVWFVTSQCCSHCLHW